MLCTARPDQFVPYSLTFGLSLGGFSLVGLDARFPAFSSLDVGLKHLHL